MRFREYLCLIMTIAVRAKAAPETRLAVKASLKWLLFLPTRRFLTFNPLALRNQKRLLVRSLSIGIAILSFFSGAAFAQARRDLSCLPNAPAPKQDSMQVPQKPRTKKVQTTLAILGKRSVFFPELASKASSLTSPEKLELAIDASIAPSRLARSAFTSGIGQARDSHPGYGQEWGGYAQRFGSSMASTATSHLFGTFLLPAVLKQ